MRIGINEVLIYSRSSGTRQRELNVLPALLRELASRGDDALLYAPHAYDAGLFAELTGGAPARIVATPIPSIPTHRRIAKGLGYWARQTRRDQLQVFHTAYYPVPRLPVPVVLTVNDVRFARQPETYPTGRRWFLRLTVPPSLRRANRIITISADTKQDLVQLYGIAPNRIDVVPIAANPRFVRVTDPSRLEQVQRRYALPAKFILYVGNLEPRKNLRRLVEAFNRLRTAPDCRHSLVLVGTPAQGADATLDYIARSPARAHICHTGYVDDTDLPALYSLADVFAFPSLHEGFGVPILEAMACAVPVVTSNCSAMPEVAGEAALLIDPTDVTAMADALDAALTDHSLRDSLVERGLSRVRTFTPAHTARLLADVYHRAAG